MIVRALADVHDAEAWLQQQGAENRPYVLTIVQLALDLAEQRLTVINEALTAYGPDVTLIG